MRILLLGDYSNVHATLADGLRSLGHEVCVASDGDGWKNYPRDIDLRRYSESWWGKLRWLLRLIGIFRTFRGYDVVQLINPVFLPLKAEKLWFFYRYLRRHNRCVVLAAFGMDHYWVKAGIDRSTFRYSDFNIGNEIRQREDNKIWIAEWLRGAKGCLNKKIAKDCDAIVAGLYEYYRSYQQDAMLREKLHFIPFPINVGEATIARPFLAEDTASVDGESVVCEKLRFFVGIQRSRHSYKGTDVMLRALRRLESEHPQEMEVCEVENVPFERYKQLLLSSHVLLDQLYSYTPAMNALQAMAQGLVVVGGGEEEHYDLLGCRDLRPIVNVLPTEEDVYRQLSVLLKNKHNVPQLSRESRMYVMRYHDHLCVAQRYVDLWRDLLCAQ